MGDYEIINRRFVVNHGGNGVVPPYWVENGFVTFLHEPDAEPSLATSAGNCSSGVGSSSSAAQSPAPGIQSPVAAADHADATGAGGAGATNGAAQDSAPELGGDAGEQVSSTTGQPSPAVGGPGAGQQGEDGPVDNGNGNNGANAFDNDAPAENPCRFPEPEPEE
ncbi:unnamed protein product [Amoebophrya sp. A120]|nr:unnamed protein product [Amoebophrya sp. A120]|eukprot:GSA120T00025321001.1